MSQEPEKLDLDRGIIPTRIGRGTARALTWAFAVAVCAVPLGQLGVELARGQRPQAFEVFDRKPTRDNLQAFERSLERASLVRKDVRERAQLGMTRALAVGNGNVIVGREGWLYYRPGIELVNGRGILDESRLTQRRKKMLEANEKNPNPDPRPAIIAFHEACRASGVHLVVFPVPDKVSLQAGHLTARLAGPTAPPVNVGHQQFVEELLAAGVDVFDPTPSGITAADPPRYLWQDTHWNPEWMQSVARGLADHVQRTGTLRPGARRFAIQELPVRRVGDLVDMLELRHDQTVFAPQDVTVRRVIDSRTGAAWQSNPDADVVLLGDSFSNIYTAPQMGWGDAAGLGPHLSAYLRRDVHAITLNGSGASGTRREFANWPSPLKGKKVVIWQFAARELVAGNWEIVPVEPSSGASDIPSPPAAPVVVEGTVLAASDAPVPGAAPYKDALGYIRLRVDRVVEGTYPVPDGIMVVAVWSMKNDVLQPGAKYKAGTRLRLRAAPLRHVPPELQIVRRIDTLPADPPGGTRHPPYLALEEKEQ